MWLSARLAMLKNCNWLSARECVKTCRAKCKSIVRSFVHRLCKALFCDLIQGRRIWRGACRYPVLCGVGSVAKCL
jgi:hypothetical protein